MPLPLSALWRRIDAPGHDGCLIRGLVLEGSAVFRHEGAPVAVQYQADPRRARVQGFWGSQPIDVTVEAGPWRLNGEPISGLDDAVQVDLSFTPATNFLQLQQLSLEVGQAADCPVAWLELFPPRLQLLPQRYERRTELGYWYEAPSVGYRGLLELTEDGLVKRYPGLWELTP